ncbi:DMT family transporter [Puteibacter caeruleilacunae]|nr:DMT family transporter [Puteibacter caeruleilacunae]
MKNSLMIYILFAVLMGALSPLQAGINAQLSQYLKHPLQATFFSFLGGIILISLIVTFLVPAFPNFSQLREVPWYLYIGGALGVVFVTGFLLLIPRIGATSLVAAVLVGQLVMSIIIDHFGWLGVQTIEISMKRLVGVILLVIGTLLVQK